MGNEIEKHTTAPLAFNGRKAKSTDEQITMALSPIPVEFPHLQVTDEWLKNRQLMLRDIDPDVLARAVLDALAGAIDFPPTVGAIRKAAGVDEKREPGPSSDADLTKLKPVPMKMFRLDPDEDRRQRQERLRQTKGWSYA